MFRFPVSLQVEKVKLMGNGIIRHDGFLSFSSPLVGTVHPLLFSGYNGFLTTYFLWVMMSWPDEARFFIHLQS